MPSTMLPFGAAGAARVSVRALSVTVTNDTSATFDVDCEPRADAADSKAVAVTVTVDSPAFTAATSTLPVIAMGSMIS